MQLTSSLKPQAEPGRGEMKWRGRTARPVASCPDRIDSGVAGPLIRRRASPRDGPDPDPGLRLT